MNPIALVVEDDPRIAETIADILFSMGHEHVWVTNQFDAQAELESKDFDYALLDLQIPARPNRGGADLQFGLHLLESIQRIKGPRRLPVVMMTGYSSDCLDLSADLLERGAWQFISKPFKSSGRTLASVIRKVLDDASSGVKAKMQPFTGGELVFFEDRVELAGVILISDRNTGQCLSVARVLRQRKDGGQFVRMSAREIAVAAQVSGGGQSVSGFIYTLRRNATERLRDQLGIDCGTHDLISHDNTGYRYHEWITDRDGDDPTRHSCVTDFGDVPAGTLSVPAGTSSVSCDVPAGTIAMWNERQVWALAELSRGVRFTRVTLEEQFRVGSKTAKRDLAELTTAGVVEYVHEGRGGYYRLRAADAPAIAPPTKRPNRPR